MRPIWLLLPALVACKPEAEDVIDATVDWSTDHEPNIAFHTPEYTVPAYSDQTMCVFDTYEGEDVAIPWAGFYQNLDFGHHVVLMASEADEDEWPDGTVADCTQTDAEIMTDARPFLFAGGLDIGTVPEMTLPDGMAVKLKEGTRFVIQSHHINPTETPVRVNDVVFLQTDDVDHTDTWAAPWVHTETDFLLPAGEETSIEVSCTFDQNVFLLSMLGHMHEWGTRYAVDHEKAAGGTSRIYEVPEWTAQYRDAPPITNFNPGDFEVQMGDSFTTTCNWTNDEDHDISFPHEMCATVGFAYPLTVPIICEGPL